MVDLVLRVFSRTLGISTPSDLDATFTAKAAGRHEPTQPVLANDPQATSAEEQSDH
jgi:hypothetical protein